MTARVQDSGAAAASFICRRDSQQKLHGMPSQVHETPETYAAVTLPYIESIPSSRIQWVYNVLERKVSSRPVQTVVVAGRYEPAVC